jgi:hypothetical protein
LRTARIELIGEAIEAVAQPFESAPHFHQLCLGWVRLTRLSPAGDRRVIVRDGEEACAWSSFRVPCFEGDCSCNANRAKRSSRSSPART